MPAIKLPSWLTWLPTGRKAAETAQGSAIGAAQRNVQDFGPWSDVLQQFVARQVNPHLFEALREALPIIDGGLNMMVTLDGIVRVEGEDAAVVDAIEEWMQTVRVNDAETGLQAFYASQGNEHYEQGFGVGEWTARKDRKGIERLRVADSKGVLFVRDGDVLRTFYRAPSVQGSGPTGLDTVESILRRTPALTVQGLLDKDYQEIDPRRMLYVALNPEADNPYGTSLLRSLEFTTQTMLRIQNALGRAWTRWGDPVFHLQYKTKNARIGEVELKARKMALQTDLATALQSKENGNSIDLVTATGMMDEILVTAIGAAQVALDPQQPLKHITEQVCAKFNMPPWLLGVDGTVGAGQSERQAELVLQAAKTRFERRRPSLEGLVATHLRLAGVTWKRGSWRLVQDLPNLQDMMKIAQAEFLRAQAAMVGGGDPDAAPRGIDNNLRSAGAPRGKRARMAATKAGGGEDGDGEPWAGDDADDMARIERSQVRAAATRWRAFAAAVGAVLGFQVARGIFTAREDEPWRFPRERQGELLALEQRFMLDNTTDDAPVLAAMFRAWTVGAESAATQLGIADDVARHRAEIAGYLRQRGGELVRNTTVRAWRERIFADIAAGAMDGLRPTTVAAQLQRKFEAGQYDWQRLVVSEMNIARSSAKLGGYERAGIEQYDYVTMGDDRVSDICLALAAAGPYRVGDPASPLPVLASHPGCRCDVVARPGDMPA